MEMSRMVQLFLGLALAVALAIYIYPTQQGQRYHVFNLMEERPTTLSTKPKALSTQPSQEYGIFYLVQQWPKTYCLNRSDCRNPIPNSSFTLHGLWPQSPTGKAPGPRECCECTDEAPKCEFNWTSIRHLKSDFERAWPNLLNEPNCSLWRSQWYKHGSCSIANVPQVDYFNAAIKLYNNFSLFNILNDAGFNESGKDYPIAKIKDTIRNGTKFKALIWCRPPKRTYVFEIVLCVNHNATNFLNCNGTYDKDKCKKNVQFP